MYDHVNAPPFQTAVQEAVFWRGAFLHHYAIVEFAVSELLLRSLYRREYRQVGKLPSKWPERLRRLGIILDAPGPLSPYASKYRALLSRITLVETDRHHLTHGRMTVREGADSGSVLFEWHDAYQGAMNELNVPLADLRYLAQELGSAAHALVVLTDDRMEAAALGPIPLEPRTVKGRSIRDF